MKTRTISLSLTWFHKFFWSLFTIAVMAWCYRDSVLSIPDQSPYIVFLLFTPAILISISLTASKSVKITDDGLEITNYRKTIKVPFNEIEGVSKKTINNAVLIAFKQPTEFGKQIFFMPKTPFKFGEYPIINELKTLAGIQADNLPHS